MTCIAPLDDGTLCGRTSAGTRTVDGLDCRLCTEHLAEYDATTSNPLEDTMTPALKTYYVLWTYAANYSNGVAEVRATDAADAAKQVLAVYGNRSDFATKGNVYVFTDPPAHAVEQGVDVTQIPLGCPNDKCREHAQCLRITRAELNAAEGVLHCDACATPLIPFTVTR